VASLVYRYIDGVEVELNAGAGGGNTAWKQGERIYLSSNWAYGGYASVMALARDDLTWGKMGYHDGEMWRGEDFLWPLSDAIGGINTGSTAPSGLLRRIGSYQDDTYDCVILQVEHDLTPGDYALILADLEYPDGNDSSRPDTIAIGSYYIVGISGVTSNTAYSWPSPRDNELRSDNTYWDEVNHQWISDISGGDGGAGGEGGLGDFALCGGVGHGANQWIVAIGSDDTDDIVIYFGKA